MLTLHTSEWCLHTTSESYAQTTYESIPHTKSESACAPDPSHTHTTASSCSRQVQVRPHACSKPCSEASPTPHHHQHTCSSLASCSIRPSMALGDAAGRVLPSVGSSAVQGPQALSASGQAGPMPCTCVAVLRCSSGGGGGFRHAFDYEHPALHSSSRQHQQQAAAAGSSRQQQEHKKQAAAS